MKKLLLVAVVFLGVVAYFQFRPGDLRDEIHLRLEVVTFGGRQYDTRTGEITHKPIDLYLSGKIMNMGEHRFSTVVVGVRIPTLVSGYRDMVKLGPIGPGEELSVDECLAEDVRAEGIGSGPLSETFVIRVEVAPTSGPPADGGAD